MFYVNLLNQAMEDPHQDEVEAALRGFERKKEREVARQASQSLFAVLVVLKHRLNEENINPELKTKYFTVTRNVGRAEKGIPRLPGAIKAGTKDRQTTGFSVGDQGQILHILTSAHCLQDTYSADLHDKLTVEEVNELFRFDVICFHQEKAVQTMDSPIMPSGRNRACTPARVVAMDTKLDLLLLAINKNDLCLHPVEDGEPIKCQLDHPVITLAPKHSSEADKLVLAGWPPQRSGDITTGQLSRCDISYDCVTGINVKGYNMKLLEAHSLVAAHGNSGGPVLNSKQQCEGVYHGVFNDSKGYAVSLSDVRRFLEKHEVVCMVL